MKKLYEKYKKTIFAFLRRLGRNFVGSFVVTFIITINTPENSKIIMDNFLVSFKGGLSLLWTAMLYPAIISAMIAGFTSVGKLIRDILRENGYEKAASKIVF